MRGSLRIAALLALSAGLSGCLGLGGSKAPPTLLKLTSSATLPAGAALSGKVEDAILVLDPETDRSLGVSRIAVQVDDSNVAYIKDAQWVERPAHLFAQLLAETIRAGGQRLVFMADDSIVASKHRLAGRLVDFGYDVRNMSAVVRYDAVRTGPGGAVSTRRFEAVVPGVKADPEHLGPALNKAANKVAAEVAAWVG